jgi:hypothetical protein
VKRQAANGKRKKPIMTSERDLLWYSLPPEGDAAWEEFEAGFRGKKPDCPLTADLIEFARGQADNATAARVKDHLPGCDACRACLEAYQHGWPEEDEEGGPPAPRGSLPEAFAAGSEAQQPAASGAAVGEPNSVVLTGIFTMLLAGRTEEALKLLEPYLPDLLSAVGLDPGLAGRLWEFLLERLRERPRAAQVPAPEWVRDFAREALNYDDLPHQPRPEDWKPVIARCALRNVQTSPEESQDVRLLLQTAIERGVTNPSYLDFLRLSGGSSAAVSGEECRRVIRKVSREEKRVARLFGLN